MQEEPAEQALAYRGGDGGLAAPRHLKATMTGGVLTLALDRPAQHNAIDAALATALRQVLEAASADPQVRVVVLQGEGTGFSCGLDDLEEAQALAALHHCARRVIPLMPQPVIAKVHGFCAGAALGLVEACDIAYAAADTAFTVSGGPVDGGAAERSGLVTFCVPSGELQAQVEALASELAAKDALVLRFTKETLLEVGSLDWDAVLDFNAAKSAQLKALQAGQPSARATLIASFLAGKSKPGLGG